MPRRAMRCTPRWMSRHCGRTWQRQDWRASRCTARRPIAAPICCAPTSAAGCATRIAARLPATPGAMLFVICDGLSAIAVQRHAPVLLAHAIPALRRTGHAVAPVVVAEQGRVALGDDIGEAMGAAAVAVLIGERPGLTAPDSLGVYLTWQPRRGRTDAERNCISNIRPDGLATAGRRRQAAVADRRDAASAPDRRRTEGRAAGCRARPVVAGQLTDCRSMPDGSTKQGLPGPDPEDRGRTTCRLLQCAPFLALSPRRSRC